MSMTFAKLWTRKNNGSNEQNKAFKIRLKKVLCSTNPSLSKSASNIEDDRIMLMGELVDYFRINSVLLFGQGNFRAEICFVYLDKSFFW